MTAPQPLSHYFFHVRGPGYELIDPEGLCYSGLIPVSMAMIGCAREFMAIDISEGRMLDLRLRIDVEQDGRLVASLAFRDAVQILN